MCECFILSSVYDASQKKVVRKKDTYHVASEGPNVSLVGILSHLQLKIEHSFVTS